MGTNIYARIHPSKEVQDEFVLKITERIDSNSMTFADDIYELASGFQDKYKKIHLGKRSSGWKFLWQANYDYYDTTKESIDKFLRRDDVELYNEYGEIITPEEVWNEYASAKGNVGDGGGEFITEEGLRFSRYDFC
jgi:hypothetical protein